MIFDIADPEFDAEELYKEFCKFKFSSLSPSLNYSITLDLWLYIKLDMNKNIVSDYNKGITSNCLSNDLVRSKLSKQLTIVWKECGLIKNT